MRKEQLFKIVKKLEKSIVGIMLANELADLVVENKKQNYAFRNLKLTEKGLSLIKESDTEIPINWIRDYIRVYNPNYNPKKKDLTINEKTISDKIQNYINNNPDITLNDILNAYQSCRDDKGDFCRKPEYFISKKLADGSYVSQLEDYISSAPTNFSTNM